MKLKILTTLEEFEKPDNIVGKAGEFPQLCGMDEKSVFCVIRKTKSRSKIPKYMVVEIDGTQDEIKLEFEEIVKIKNL